MTQMIKYTVSGYPWHNKQNTDQQNRKGTTIKFYNTIAIPTLMYEGKVG